MQTIERDAYSNGFRHLNRRLAADEQIPRSPTLVELLSACTGAMYAPVPVEEPAADAAADELDELA